LYTRIEPRSWQNVRNVFFFDYECRNVAAVSVVSGRDQQVNSTKVEIMLAACHSCPLSDDAIIASLEQDEDVNVQSTTRLFKKVARFAAIVRTSRESSIVPSRGHHDHASSHS